MWREQHKPHNTVSVKWNTVWKGTFPRVGYWVDTAKVNSFPLFHSSHSWSPKQIQYPCLAQKKTTLINSLWHSSLLEQIQRFDSTHRWWSFQTVPPETPLLERPPVRKHRDQSHPKGQRVCHLLSRLLQCLWPGSPTGRPPLTADDPAWLTACLLSGQPKASPAHPGGCSALADVLHQVPFNWTQIKSLGSDEPGLLEDLFIPHGPLITCWTWRYWDTIQISLHSGLFSIQITGLACASS